MTDESKYIFGTCVSKRATFEYKYKDYVFTPMGFATVESVRDDGRVTCVAADPDVYELNTYSTEEIEHVSATEWPYYESEGIQEQ